MLHSEKVLRYSGTNADITYLQYGNGCRAYMSVMKDLGTKEVVHFKVFGCPNIELVMGGVNEFLSSIPLKKRKRLLSHSDQGGHYTSKRYQDILKSKDSCKNNIDIYIKTCILKIWMMKPKGFGLNLQVFSQV